MSQRLARPRRATRIATRIAATLLAAAAGAAAAQLTIPAQSPASSRSLVVPIALQSQGDSLSAVQFDLTYDPALVSVRPGLGSSAYLAAKTISFATLSAGRLRCVVSGMNQAPLADGPLLLLYLDLLPGSSAQRALGFSNASAVAPDGSVMALSSVDGAIAVAPSAGAGPDVSAAGVLNGASFIAGPVAPGEVLQLIGAGIGPNADGSGGATAVLFDGVQAPLIYAQPGVLGIIAPYSLAGRPNSVLQVVQGGRQQIQVSVPVAVTNPGIFTLGSTGAGQGAILNQDYSINGPGAPASRGSVVMLYATGLGLLTPPEADGQTHHETPVGVAASLSVMIGGQDATVLYAGPAEGIVSGVEQLNVLVPAGVAPGIQPVTVTAGGAVSQSGVTLAVQ